MHLTIMLKYLKIPQIPGLKMRFFCPLCLENNFITVQVPVKGTDNPNNPTLRSVGFTYLLYLLYSLKQWM